MAAFSPAAAASSDLPWSYCPSATATDAPGRQPYVRRYRRIIIASIVRYGPQSSECRRGKHDSVRVRRTLIIMASASGTPVPAIARLVAADEDTVRGVIHRFNEIGLRALDPRWAGGRPRRISDDDEASIVATAKVRPGKLGRPFTRWSLRKLADYSLAGGPLRRGCLRRGLIRPHDRVSGPLRPAVAGTRPILRIIGPCPGRGWLAAAGW
jgi:transposase